MNLSDQVQRERCFKSIETIFRTLLPFRELNRQLVEEYVGAAYGAPARGNRKDDYLNMMNQTVVAYTMALCANRPRITVDSANLARTQFAKHFQLAMNNFMCEIHLEQTMKQWVEDAFFMIGIVKVHRADAGEVQIQDDLWMDPGQPYASNVSLDNWVFDLGATKYHQVKFAGDIYRVPHADLTNSIYDQSQTRGVVPTSKYGIEENRLDHISKGYEVDQDEIEPMVDLADVWFPREKKIFTFIVDNISQFRLKGAPIADMDDDEYPDTGPYHLLGFNGVPENIMYTSPASHLSMMHRLINNIMRKQARRARSQKLSHLYTPAGADAAKNIQRSSDDDWVACQDVREVAEHMTGGVDQNAQAFLLGIMQMFDRQAGNLTAMLGLGAQTGTVGQEEIIKGSVSNVEASMQFKVVDASVKLIRNLGCMLYSDKTKVIPGKMEIEGASGYSVDSTWTPDYRDGEFHDYDLNVDMYSLPYTSPSQKIKSIVEILEKLFLPLLPMIQQQGGTLNFEKLVNDVSEMTNLPQLRGLIQFSTPPTEDNPATGGNQPGTPEQPGMPANTTRKYVRKNVPTGGTSQSRSTIEQQGWMNGGAANQDQRASLNRAPA